MNDHEQLDLDVVENTDADRFEAHAGGEVVALVEYRHAQGSLVVTHTETADEYEGKGIAARLVRGMLDQLRDAGRTIQVQCPYVAAYLRKHPEYGDLVEPAKAD